MAKVGEIAIAPAEVPADQVDYPLRIFLSDLDAAAHAQLSEGAPELRIFDSDGTTGLPREVVWYDAAANDGEVHTLLPVITTAGKTIEVHIESGGSEPPLTDPIGRNAVWADYSFVLHFQSDLTDSTGQNTFSVVGSITQNVGSITIAGQSGFLQSTIGNYDLNNGYIFSIDGIIDEISTGQPDWAASFYAGSSFGIYRASGNLTGRWDHGSHVTTTAAVAGWDGADTLKHYRWDTADACPYIDGVAVEPRAYTEIPSPSASMNLLAQTGQDRSLNGTYRDIRLYKGDRDADWISMEAANHQHETTPFYTYSPASVTPGEEMAASITAAATVAGTLARVAGLVGSLAGSAAVAGTLTPGEVPSAEMQGELVGTSTLQGTILLPGGLAGTLDGTSSVTATLSGSSALRGTLDGSSTLQGILQQVQLLAGLLTGTSTAILEAPALYDAPRFAMTQDLSPLFEVEEFAFDATLNGLIDFKCIFTDFYSEILGGELNLSGTEPWAYAELSDIPNVTEGNEIAIQGNTWTVREVHYTNTGLVRLRLERD